MNQFIEIINKKERQIIGLMSGTSLDGVDIAFARFRGAGSGVTIEPIAFSSYPFSTSWRQRIQNAFNTDTEEICRIHYDLGHLFADLIERFRKENHISGGQIDAIGSHGQTLFHVHHHSTLQAGESEIIAHRHDCVVISDFRSGDIAAGGSGAPLVPYLDYALYREPGQRIGLLNLGGIANITCLPGNPNEAVLAFDTGPANAILNETVELLTGGEHPFDKNGSFSKQGVVVPKLLEELLSHPYFDTPPPKSTGREAFGKAFVQNMVRQHANIRLNDLLRTFVAFIARSVKHSCDRWLYPLDTIYVSGGGVHHPLLMEDLKGGFGEGIVQSLPTRSGITVDSKEAVAFALLAHECLNGTPTNIPSVTGAGQPAILGKITLP